MITVSDNAVVKIKNILSAEQKSDGFIRVGIKGGGCSGFTYVLDIEDNQKETDRF